MQIYQKAAISMKQGARDLVAEAIL
jgi:hypothetical protein